MSVIVFHQCSVLFFSTALLRYNSHTVQFIHLMCTIQWFFTYSQNYATVITVHDLKGNPVPINSHSPGPLPPAPGHRNTWFLHIRSVTTWYSTIYLIKAQIFFHLAIKYSKPPCLMKEQHSVPSAPWLIDSYFRFNLLPTLCRYKQRHGKYLLCIPFFPGLGPPNPYNRSLEYPGFDYLHGFSRHSDRLLFWGTLGNTGGPRFYPTSPASAINAC